MTPFLGPLLAAFALSLAAPPDPTAPAGPADSSAEVTVLRRCVVEYERNTPIGSPYYGLLEDCLVEPGNVVKAGQILGRLQGAELRAEVKLREAQASSDIEVRLGEARLAQALNKSRRTAALVRRNAASREEDALHRLEADAASLEVEQAKYRRMVAGLQLDQARATLKTRDLASPHDGVVVAVLRRKGEPVAPREPVFQVVDADQLRIVGQVDVAEAGKLRVGQDVRVVPEVAGADLPIEREVFAGKLVFIDTQVDPATRTCKVHVRADNRDRLLRAGLEARLEFDPPAAARATTPAPKLHGGL